MFVADYVLMEYGTGALMAVPAHDQRDHDFARAFGLEIREVDRRRATDIQGRALRRRRRRCVNSAAASTGSDNRDGVSRRSSRGWTSEGKGERGGQLPPSRLAALPPALLGLPDPDRVLRRPAAMVPVPDDQLPVELPDVEDYAPEGPEPAGRGHRAG